MTLYRKLIAILIALLLLCPILCACGDKQYETPVGSCGDYEILYEEIRYEALTYLTLHPDCPETELREEVENHLCNRYAVLLLCKKYLPNSDLNSPELEERAQADIDSMIESLGGKSEYQKQLESIHASEGFYKKFVKLSLLQTDLENTLFQNTELKNATELTNWWMEGNCSKVLRLTFPDESTADDARHRLLDGDTIDALLKETAFANASLGKNEYFFRNLRNTQEETIALKLQQTRDISEVFSTENGYTLLISQALTEEDQTMLASYQAPTALNIYREAELNQLLAEVSSTLKMNWNDYGAELVLKNIKS